MKEFISKMFSKGDLAMVIGLEILSLALVAVGVFVNMPTGAMVASIGLAVMLDLILFLFIYKMKYLTWLKIKDARVDEEFNVSWLLSPKTNKLGDALVGALIIKTVHFWAYNQTVLPITEAQAKEYISGIRITFLDQKSIMIEHPFKMEVHAFYQPPDRVFIATSPKTMTSDTDFSRVSSLIIHELSHPITSKQDDTYYNYVKAHQLFKDAGLGH